MIKVDCKLTNERNAIGAEIMFEHGNTGHSCGVRVSPHDLMNDPGVVFDTVKAALLQLAGQLRDTQTRLIAADKLDLQNAIDDYTKNGMTSRRIGLSTAELVYGMVQDETSHYDYMVIDLPDFDVRIKKKNPYANALASQNWAFKVFESGADIAQQSEGTRCIINQLKEAAAQVQGWYNTAVRGQFQISGADETVREDGSTALTVRSLMSDLDSGDPEDKQYHGALPWVTREYTETDDIRDVQETQVKDLVLGYTIGDRMYVAPVVNGKITHNGNVFDKEDVYNNSTVSGRIDTSLQMLAADFVDTMETVGMAIGKPKNVQNPMYWTHFAWSKLDDIRRQANRILPEEDSTRDLLEAITKLLSDHMHRLSSARKDVNE